MSLRNKRNIKRGAGLCALSLIAGMSIFANVGGSVSARPMNPSGTGGSGSRRLALPTSNSNSSLTRHSSPSGGANSSSRLGSPTGLGSGSSSPTRLGASGGGTVQVPFTKRDGTKVNVTAQSEQSRNTSGYGSPTSNDTGVLQTKLTGPSGNEVDLTVQDGNSGFWGSTAGQRLLLESFQNGNTGPTSRGTGIRPTPLTQQQRNDVYDIIRRNTTQR